MPYSVRAEGIEAIQEEWERVLPSCSTNTVFVTPWWQQVWWRHFGDGQELHILSVRDEDEVAGIAPLMLNDGVLSFVGDKDLFDYLDFLVPRGKEEVFYGALWDYLMKMDWQRLELTSLPQDSPTLTYLPRLASAKGLTADVSQEEMTPVVSLPSSWDDYLLGLTKKDRHELRRKLRRLEGAEDSRQYVCNDPDTLHCSMQDFFRLLKASSAEKSSFMTREREQFFMDVALDLTARDQLKLYFLEINGVRVASCMCFDYGDSYLLYNSGYDPSYSSLSVGLLNKALCIRDAIDDGRGTFNFLKGTDRYKYDLGGKDRAVCGLVIRR